MSELVVTRTGLREPVNALTHLIAAAAAGLGLVALLVLGWGDPLRVASLLVYGLSLTLLFAASGIYHAVNAGPVVTARLRKFDHSAIYLLIAGTYTPICLHFFTGFWQWGLVAVIWALALTGIIVKLFVIHAPRWTTAGVYLVMGWLGVLGVREMVRQMPPSAIIWLALGGALFTVGAVIYVIKRPDPWPGVFGFHEIWHIFIIFAALAHFILIARYVAAA
jgi:hemolysin III